MADTIYLIPGLGFDQRIFKNLELNTNTAKCIEYIDPLEKENLQQYVARLIDANLDKNDSITLIGHSLGGIIAQEIAKQIEVKKIILISSIKSKKENPFHFKLIGTFRLHTFFNKNWTIKTFPFWAKFHGYLDTESQELFVEMIKTHSDQYLQWALYQLSIWEGIDDLKTPIVHIHGEKDKTFPVGLVSKPIIVKNGTHVMIYNKAEELSELINEAI
jgi:pimeloyl-ACP methyl ester carboxylesterase